MRTFILGLCCGSLAAGVAGTTGCGAEPLPSPALLEVCQARFPERCTSWLYAGERVPVRILGTGLHGGLDVDLGDPDAPGLARTFELEVGGQGVAGAELLGLTESGLGVLFGWLPPSLPVGMHDVLVRTPLGLEAALPDGLEVRSPLRVRALSSRSRLAPGERALLTLEAANEGLEGLDGVRLRLHVEPPGLVSLAPLPAAFGLGPATRQTFLVELQALAVGSAELSLSATGTAGEIVPLSAEAPRAVSLEIR